MVSLGFGGVPPPPLGWWGTLPYGVGLGLIRHGLDLIFHASKPLQTQAISIFKFDQIFLILINLKTNYGLVVKKSA